ncbi:hypothetical protein [Moorena sp. SIO3H5]|uniref:hypothetical protein n=1 Tax=Moorena sp. SIO3H5 TaxID=2607834 RepID=UPI0013B7A234|nr:hypothetical protein [Moorena sp. SIO3H5]NEO73287.1 hypothetical protein [Moorena sp. SIO3H5]
MLKKYLGSDRQEARGKSDAARSWEGSAVLGVPPMSNCRGFPHERLHQDGKSSGVLIRAREAVTFIICAYVLSLWIA